MNVPEFYREAFEGDIDTMYEIVRHSNQKREEFVNYASLKLQTITDDFRHEITDPFIPRIPKPRYGRYFVAGGFYTGVFSLLDGPIATAAVVAMPLITIGSAIGDTVNYSIDKKKEPELTDESKRFLFASFFATSLSSQNS